MTITINGKQYDTHAIGHHRLHDEFSYERILQIGGYRDDRLRTITYRTPDARGGTLTRGQTADVPDGSIFNVADTSNA